MAEEGRRNLLRNVPKKMLSMYGPQGKTHPK
jgi:hypothetical protein